MWERTLALVRGNPILTRHLATTTLQAVARLFRQIDEDEAAPGFERHAVQREVGQADIVCRRSPRRSLEFAGQRVRPGMVGANDSPLAERARFHLTQHGAAVPAGVVKSA